MDIVKSIPRALVKPFHCYYTLIGNVVGYPRFMVDGPEGTIIDFIVSEKIICDQVEQDYINTKRGSQ